jgi:hypothetical protein
MGTLAWIIKTLWPILFPLAEKWWGKQQWLMELDSAVNEAKEAKSAEEKLAASKRLHEALKR